jgi:hypothetical protein
MKAELETAIADGAPIGFALGCLVAAWRELPAQSEGRFTLATHAFAIGLIVPVAGLLLSGGLLGYPYLAFGKVGISGFLEGNSEQVPLLTVGDWGLAPALTLLVLIEAAGQFLVAWFLLERDWSRVMALARFNAATVTTLLIVASLLALPPFSTLLPSAALIAELLAVLAFAFRHEQSSHGVLAQDPGG